MWHDSICTYVAFVFLTMIRRAHITNSASFHTSYSFTCGMSTLCIRHVRPWNPSKSPSTPMSWRDHRASTCHFYTVMPRPAEWRVCSYLQLQRDLALISLRQRGRPSIRLTLHWLVHVSPIRRSQWTQIKLNPGETSYVFLLYLLRTVNWKPRLLWTMAQQVINVTV